MNEHELLKHNRMLLIELDQQKERAQRAENDCYRYRLAFHFLTTKKWYLEHHEELLAYLKKNPIL